MRRIVGAGLVRGAFAIGMMVTFLPANMGMHVAAATVLVAPTGTDVGNCTAVACKHLAYALSVASDGDTISVAAGTYGEPNLTLNKSVTIAGAGSATTTVDAGYLSRVFSIAAGKTVTISGFTITRGYPGKGSNGGAILNLGMLTLTNDVVNASYVNTYYVMTPFSQMIANGAGIYSDTNATLTLNGTTVTGNTAGMPPVVDVNDPPEGGAGGGIYTLGAMTITGSTISANTAIEGVTGGEGGGIAIHNDSATVTITNSTITANRADSYGVGLSEDANTSMPGNLILDHVTVSNHTAHPSVQSRLNPAVETSSNSLTMTNTMIVGNAAGGMNAQTTQCFTISDSTISNNTGPFVGGLQINAIHNGCTNTITRTVISGNTSLQNNVGSTTGGLNLYGDMTVITDSQITGNTGSDGGMIAKGTLTINNSAISNNVSNTGGSASANPFAGGINWGSVDGSNDGTTLTITNSTISGNSSDATGFAASGGILVNGPTTITGSTISGNSGRSSQGSSGLTAEGASAGVPIHLTNSTVSGNASAPALYVIGSGTILTNTTVAANTTGVGNNSTNLGTLTVTNSILSNAGVNCGLGTITSGGYNIVSDLSCGFAGGGTDQIGVNPNIAPLANNGGPTLTHALNPGSPAINKIPAIGGCNGAGLTTDQRGTPRPTGGACDIGAFEFAVNATPGQQPSGPVTGNPAPLPAGGQPSAPVTGNPAPLPGRRPGGASSAAGASGGTAPMPLPTHR